MIDVCIPVYKNLRCFEMCLRGLKKHLVGSARIYLHIQEEEEVAVSTEICKRVGFSFAIVPSVGKGKTMDLILNALFNACESDWVIMTEQDVFFHQSPDEWIPGLSRSGCIICGPLDTLHLSHTMARNQPRYGQYARLSPEPGYFHSSLIFLDRKAVASLSSTPFTIPEGFRLHGYGVLGGEPYYGLRINCGKDASKLNFLRQSHSSYGYGASIETGAGLRLFATHLYWSSANIDRRHDGKFLTHAEQEWLISEENRFLKMYENTL